MKKHKHCFLKNSNDKLHDIPYILFHWFIIKIECVFMTIDN